MKSYTSLEQSKKLVEFLPFESADMCYKCIDEDPYDVVLRPYSEWKEEYKGLLVGKEVDVVPCWSLAALLNILPEIQGSKPVIALDDNYITYPHMSGLHFKADNLIDACYEMILKLHEQNIL